MKPVVVVVLALMAGCTKPDNMGCDNLLYLDVDADGFGDANSEAACDADHVASSNDDCDDGNPAVNPDAAEVCNTVDDDCDGAVDDGFDVDGDGHQATACATGDDCDDDAAGVYPGATETCGDSIDSDCSGADTTCQVDAPLSDGSFAYCSLPNFETAQLIDVGDVDDDGDAEVLAASMVADGLAGGGWLLNPSSLAADIDLDASAYRLKGVSSGDGGGRSIAVGDVNGDGNEDVAIGAPFGASCYVFVVFGPVTADRDLSKADLTITASGATSYCGHGSDLSDINGDGIADAVIGAYASGEGGLQAGVVHIAYGPLTAGTLDLTTDADARLVGDSVNAWAGRVVRNADDLDGDGLGDMIAAAVGLTLGGPDAGGAYVIYGAPTGVSSLKDADGRLVGEDPYDYAGVSLATGDVNDDGLSDVIVGAQNSKFNLLAGAAYVVYGPAAGDIDLSTANVIVRGDAESQFAAGGMATGDVDGDGDAELVLGAPGDASAGAWTGGAYLFDGVAAGEHTLADADVRMVGERAGSEAGWGIAVGDVDGDGRGEVLVGAPRDAFGGTAAGGFYILSLD